MTENEQIVTPFQVSSDSSINYDKLVNDFGCSRIDQTLLAKFTEITGHKPHPFLRQGIFFSHRDFGILLDHHAKGKPFYIYTGRGPSSQDLHLGHLVPMLFTAWLQKVFQVPVVIQITDDEKFLFKQLQLSEIHKMARKNIADILSCGFDISKTFVFCNTKYVQHMYENVLEIQKRITVNHCNGTFGFDGSSNIGQISFPAMQIAPCFATSFAQIFDLTQTKPKDVMCLIPCAIDQDPYFRLTREIAPRMKFRKPVLLHSRFLPSLAGVGTKMSASDPLHAIFVTDSAKKVRKKINKSFSGGQQLLEDHRRLGGNPDVDVSFHLLKIFLDDDGKLQEIRRKFASGHMSCGEIKALANMTIASMLQTFNASKPSDIQIQKVQEIRAMLFK